MGINFESHTIDRRSFLKGAGVLRAAGLLSACGGSKSDNGTASSAASGTAAPNTTGADPISEYISFESANRELESWNMLYTQQASDANVITNLWDGLLSFDCYGKVAPAIASSWEHNEDSTVWTFHLRDDVDWVDVNGEVKTHLTSKDFLVGFEWVMNSYKNEANNTTMPNDNVVGAADYYAHTKELGDAAADLTYEDMLSFGVGVEAPDDYTLVFTCPNSCPYFDTVAAYNSFYPAAEDLINELGIEGFRACDNTTMWYCGPYIVEEYIQGNTKSYIPNPSCTTAPARRERRALHRDHAERYDHRLPAVPEPRAGRDRSDGVHPDHHHQRPQQRVQQPAVREAPQEVQLLLPLQLCPATTPDGTPDENWNKATPTRLSASASPQEPGAGPFYARYNKINLKSENDTCIDERPEHTPTAPTTPPWWPTSWALAARLTTARP